MTNLEKLRTGTDEEVLHLMQRFAYRSNAYTYQELQTAEFLEEECYVTTRVRQLNDNFMLTVFLLAVIL